MRIRFSKSVACCPELELVASFGTMAETQAWLGDSANQLDVLLVDLGLPDGSGLDLIRYAVHLHPRCEPLVISMFADDANVLASIEAGALGYIHKDATPDDIAKTILDMRNGESPISPLIARRVLIKYRKSDEATSLGGAVDMEGAPIAASGYPHETQASADASRKLLSPRQLEVLQLISRGYSYVEIAKLQGVALSNEV